MDRRDVMLIGVDADFAALAIAHLSSNGWDTTCADLSTFQPDAPAISGETVLVVALGPHPGTAIDKIREIRNRLGYGPGVIAVTDGEGVAEALDAGADIFLNACRAENILPAAVAALRDMVSRWNPPPQERTGT